LCHVHINASAHDQNFDSRFNALPTSKPQVPQSQIDQLIVDCEHVFPDMEMVTPHELRQQAIGTVTAAVSIEMYRCLPSVDGTNPEKRDQLLDEWHRYVVHSTEPRNNYHVNWEEASSLADSSIDEYGRGLQESAELASFALVQEWKMAKMLNQNVDEYGHPYEENLDEFLLRMAPVIGMHSSNEYYRNLHWYSKIVQDATGQPPLTQAPPPNIIPRSRLDLLSSENLRIAHSQGYLAPEEVDYMNQRFANEAVMAQQHEARLRSQEQNRQLMGAATALGGMALGAMFSGQARRRATRAATTKSTAQLWEESRQRKRDAENQEIHRANLRSARSRNFNRWT